MTPDRLDEIINSLTICEEYQRTESLEELRRQIDSCDNDLVDILAKRMRICREISTFKKGHNITILQTSRINEIIEKRQEQSSYSFNFNHIRTVRKQDFRTVRTNFKILHYYFFCAFLHEVEDLHSFA